MKKTNEIKIEKDIRIPGTDIILEAGDRIQIKEAHSFTGNEDPTDFGFIKVSSWDAIPSKSTDAFKAGKLKSPSFYRVVGKFIEVLVDEKWSMELKKQYRNDASVGAVSYDNKKEWLFITLDK